MYPTPTQNSAKNDWAALYPKDYDDPLYQDDESIASFMESLIPIPLDESKRRKPISKSQNLAEARELFYSGADLDEFDENQRSPLIAAARKGNLELAKWLIAKKASIELRDDKSHGPLWHAFRKSSAEVAELLIQSGAKIDAVSKSGATPFQRAAESEMLGAVAWMLESKSMRPPRTFGSALHILAHFPMDHVLNWILSAAPAIDFTLRNRHGEMAHEYMARLGHSGTDVCAQLLASAERQMMNETIEAEVFFRQAEGSESDVTLCAPPLAAQAKSPRAGKMRL
jgi:ankyrin repeat protein